VSELLTNLPYCAVRSRLNFAFESTLSGLVYGGRLKRYREFVGKD